MGDSQYTLRCYDRTQMKPGSTKEDVARWINWQRIAVSGPFPTNKQPSEWATVQPYVDTLKSIGVPPGPPPSQNPCEPTMDAILTDKDHPERLAMIGAGIGVVVAGIVSPKLAHVALSTAVGALVGYVANKVSNLKMRY